MKEEEMRVLAWLILEGLKKFGLMATVEQREVLERYERERFEENVKWIAGVMEGVKGEVGK